MLGYVLKRLGHLVIVIWIIITITFAMMHAIPGGPFDSERYVAEEIRAHIEARYRLDEPLYRQYLDYLLHVVQGDLGPSLTYEGRRVNDIIKDGFPKSALLGFVSVLVSLLIGVPVGVYSAFRHNRWQDHTVMLMAIVGVSVPSFILATLLVYYFGLKLQWLPAAGWGSVQQIVLPVLALSGFSLAFITRLTRASMLDVMGQDYIRTAQAKGVAQGVILFRHALKNAVLPVVTYLGPLIAAVFTGSFVVEKIFNIPGLGQFFVTSVANRDYTVILGVTVFYGTLLVTMNILVDLVYMFLDPRIVLYKQG